MKDYYKILGVHPEASKEQIHNAYRFLAKKYHPDHNPDPHAAEIFLEIQEAFECLSNPARRNGYDAQLRHSRSLANAGSRGIAPFSAANRKKLAAYIGGAFLAGALLFLGNGAVTPFTSGRVAEQIAAIERQITDNELALPDFSGLTEEHVSRLNYPTRCRHSGETRLSVGQEGTVVIWGLRLRDRGLLGGTELDAGVRFVTIGEPFCGSYRGSSLELLWWPVEILSGTHRGQQGWIAESGCADNLCNIAYNVRP